jgi:hypothetical protein
MFATLPRPRAATIRVAAVGAAIALAACARDAAFGTGPGAPANRPDIRLAGGSVITGRAITVVRGSQPGALLPRTLFVDTSRYRTTLAGARTSVAVETRAGSLEFPIATLGAIARGGSWRHAGRPRSGAAVDLEFRSVNGAPASEVVARVGGEIVSRTVDHWLRARGGWLLQEREIIAYRQGLEVGRIETTFETDLQLLAATTPRRAVLVAMTEAAADALRPILTGAAGLLLPATLQAQSSAACGQEVNYAFDTIDGYIASLANFARALESENPFAIAAAIVVTNAAYQKMDRAQLTLDDCVAQIGVRPKGP